MFSGIEYRSGEGNGLLLATGLFFLCHCFWDMRSSVVLILGELVLAVSRLGVIESAWGTLLSMVFRR